MTLEPCSHYGRTPPCTEAIIEAKLSRVVVGSDDPNPLVAGRGIQRLRAAGIRVETGFLKEECDELNSIFFHYITTGMPYVIMKYAMTADGKIATAKGLSKWITGEKSRERVHQTRKRVAAIMAGIETVLRDNPMLNCRVEHPSHPVRIVCDSKLRIPKDCALVQTSAEIPTYVAATEESLDIPENSEKAALLREKRVGILKTRSREGRVDMKHLMELLGEMKLDSLLLEGGGELNFSALQQGIVSRLEVYLAPKIFGGREAKSPVGGSGAEEPKDAFRLSKPRVTEIGGDILLEYDVLKEKEEGA